MAKKKRKAKRATRVQTVVTGMVQIGEVEPGDLCYFRACDNKIKWGEVLQVITDGIQEPALKLLDQADFKYHVAPIRYAAWEDKYLKNIKWDLKADLSREDI